MFVRAVVSQPRKDAPKLNIYRISIEGIVWMGVIRRVYTEDTTVVLMPYWRMK